MDIQTKDGILLRNIPDGTPDSVIKARLDKIRAGDLIDPTSGMSGFDKFAAGAGKAVVDTGRGVGQLLGLVSNEDVAQARERDAPLMDTGAGMTGNVLGNIAMALAPGGALKGAGVVANAAGQAGTAARLATAGGALMAPRSIGGALATGAGMGVIQPATSMSERLTNTGIGAGASAAFPVLGRAYTAGKSAVEPFYQGGRDQILARALRESAGGGQYADDALAALKNAGELVPGSAPTAAQAANNAGIASLERAAVSTNPAVTVEHTARMGAQNTARTNALRDMAGGGGRLEGAIADREAAVSALYDQAKNTKVPTDPTLQGLLRRPAIQQAMREAEINAANRGGSGIVGETVNIPRGQSFTDAAKALPDSAYFKEGGGELLDGGRGDSVLQAIRKMGGIHKSELSEIVGESNARTARTPVALFSKGADGIDDLASRLHEAGYIPRKEFADDGGVQWLRNAIREELDGNKVFALHDMPMYAPSGAIKNEATGLGSHYFENKGDAVYSGRALHELKMALDASRNVAPSQAANKAALSGIGDAATHYNDWLDKAIPVYGQAKNTYAEMSKPIGAMNTAAEIANRSIRKSDDVMTLNSLARALTDDSAAKATGFRKATLENTMSPENMAMLNALKQDLQRAQFAKDAGRGPGSNTVQNLAYSNILNQAGVPNMLRAFAPGQLMGNLLARGGDVAYTKANQQLSEQLAQALLSPKETARLMAMTPSQRQALLAEALTRGGASLGMTAPAMLNAQQQ